MVNLARLNVGLEGVAIAERAYQAARHCARDRVHGQTLGREAAPSKTISGPPDVRRMLMDMKTRIEAMRALAHYTAGQNFRVHGQADAAQRQSVQAQVDRLIPVVKGWCTENALGITATGMQVHSGMGFVLATGVAQYLGDVRTTTIYDGTTAVQASDLIVRKLVRGGGAGMRRLIGRMAAYTDAISGQDDALLTTVVSTLMTGLAAQEQAPAGLLARAPREAAAGAVPYLGLCATVIGGWLMARAADAATSQLTLGGKAHADADADFLNARRITAHPDALHLLPQAAALRDAVLHGAVSTLGLSDTQC